MSGNAKKIANGQLQKEATEVLHWLNDRTGQHFRDTDATLKPIIARLKDGATVRECRAVIAVKVREWKGTDMSKFLRPATLFGAEKFSQYVGEIPDAKNDQ